MQLTRAGERSSELPAVRHEGVRYDLSPLTDDIDGRFLAGDVVCCVCEAVSTGSLTEIADAAGLRVGAPVARPSAVLRIGQNHEVHAAESGSEPPTAPIIFLKHPNTVVGPYDDVLIRPGATTVGCEVAPAVVSGRTVGPRSRVNGEPRQDSSTADMIFGVHELIRHPSHYLVLEAGDIITTGTPQGGALSGRSPYLTAGEAVELEIDEPGPKRRTAPDLASGGATSCSASRR
jgi:2-keto-4-pentenoate hydratase/2-oxohepta-3-ene-1,7-dioic acid hydratase in catechol pathway